MTRRLMSMAFSALAGLATAGCDSANLKKVRICFDDCGRGDESPSSAAVRDENSPLTGYSPPMAANRVLPASTIDSAALVDGVARIYDRNVKSALVDVPLRLVGDGTLTGDVFKTATGSEARASAADENFVFAPDDARFREASMFANAARALAWFESLGFDNQREPIDLVVNWDSEGSDNNANYIPSYDPATQASVRIGKGDGKIFKNLGTDADIVTHELGHHVIFRRVTSTQGSSLLVHEGLADAFVELRNDDPCMAASICVDGGSDAVCKEHPLCLRSADNDYTLDDPQWDPQARIFRSQALSGMIWDVRKSRLIAPRDLAALVLKSVERLHEQSGVPEFVAALLAEDQSANAGRLQDVITSASQARHLIP